MEKKLSTEKSLNLPQILKILEKLYCRTKWQTGGVFPVNFHVVN